MNEVTQADWILNQKKKKKNQKKEMEISEAQHINISANK